MIKIINKRRKSRLERKIALLEARIDSYGKTEKAGWQLGYHVADKVAEAHENLSMANYDLAKLDD